MFIVTRRIVMKKFMYVGLLAVLIGSGCGERVAQNDSSVRKVGVLRVLRPATAMASLPRGEHPEAREVALIRNYAKDQNLEIEWTRVSPTRLADELLAGQGDMAIGCRLEWMDPEAKVSFSRLYSVRGNPTRPQMNWLPGVMTRKPYGPCRNLPENYSKASTPF